MTSKKTSYTTVGDDGGKEAPSQASSMVEGEIIKEGEIDKTYDETVPALAKPILKPVRMPNFDGLRGIGVSIVLIYHMGYHLFKNAWLVISMFFSASGFLITAITVEAFERRGKVDILKFWAKRVSRLFPALLMMCCVLVVTQKFRIDDGMTFQREAEDLYYAIFFLTNYNLVYNNEDNYFNDFAKPSITRHLWTLSIEEQYYIVWPLVMYTLTRIFGRKKRDAFGS